MQCPIGEEQVMSDARHYCRDITPDAGHVPDGQTETHKTGWVEDVDILEVRCATGYFFLVFVGATKVGVCAQVVGTLVGWWLVAIAPKCNMLCKISQFWPLCRVHKIARACDRKIELEYIVVHLGDDAATLFVRRSPVCRQV